MFKTLPLAFSSNMDRDLNLVKVLSEFKNRVCKGCCCKSADVDVWGCLWCSLIAFSFLTGNIQEVILQEHIEKEDEVLVSLAGLKQVGLLLYYTHCCDMFLDFVYVTMCVFSVCPSDQRHS